MDERSDACPTTFHSIAWTTPPRALTSGLDAWLVTNDTCQALAPAPSTLEQIRPENLTLIAWEQIE